MATKKKKAGRPKGSKTPKVAVIRHIEIPTPEIPVEGVVVVVAKDKIAAETLYQHLVKGLKKAGHGFAEFFHND